MTSTTRRPTRHADRTADALVALLLAVGLLLVPGAAAAQDGDRAGPDTARPAIELSCHPVADGARPIIGCRWTAGPEGTVGYELLRASRASDGAETIARAGLDQQGFRDAEVRVGLRYTYLLRAVAADGGVIASSNRATTGIRPMHLACQPTQRDPSPAHAIGCRWTAGPEGTRGYVVLRWDARSDRVTRVAHVGADTRGVVDDGVSPGIRYTYLVRALDGDGHVLTHTNTVTTGIPAS